MPRMAQVLTRLRSSQSAFATPSGSSWSTRAHAVSSADDISWACSPPILATTSSSPVRGTRASRWCFATRHAITLGQVSAGAVIPGTLGRRGP